MRLHQLELVVRFAQDRCEALGWVNFQGEVDRPQTINLYSVVDHIIKPATQLCRCSYVELVANSPQPPEWFVSHWWGEPVVDFVACLEQHSKDRELPVDTSYWVCAYANNQWNIQADMGDDPSTSSFRRAMRLCKGTVSVLDPGAVCYSRVWCIFEIFISIGDRPPSDTDYLYDVYTSGLDGRYTETSGVTAVGITDGYVPADGSVKERARKKRHRELRFPWELQLRALAVELQTAQASQDADRRQILNSIAGAADLTLEPPTEHPAYDSLNAMLRGRFAAASVVKAVERGHDVGLLGRLLAASGLATVSLHFGGESRKVLGDHVVELLARSLPPRLEQLFLGFAGCLLLTDASARAVAAQLPPRAATMRTLALRFTACKSITGEGIDALAAGVCTLRNLRHIELDFQQCRLPASAGVLIAEALGDLERAAAALEPPQELESVILRGLQISGSKGLTSEASKVLRRARTAELQGDTTAGT